MLDMFLVPDRLVNGPRRVTMTVRPERLAFLVDPTEPASALAAIESACLTWGGVRQFLIPCAPGRQPDAVWSAILEKHDPDVILDLVGADQNYADEQRGRLARQVERWDRPSETMEIIGAVVFASLRRWKRMRSSDRARVAINLNPLADNPYALQLAFRLGHLDPRPMDANMVTERSYRSARIGDFVDLRQVDPRRLEEAEWRRLATEVPLRIDTLADPTVTAGMTDYYKLPHLTSIGLPSQEPGYVFLGAPNPEREQNDEAYFSRLVVLGSPDSVEDLCLTWNLRAQRPSLQFFPQWINPQWIADADVRQSLYWGLRWENPGLAEEGQALSIHLMSASLTVDELTAAAPDLGVPVVAHERATLDRFFTSDLRVGLEQVSVANFHDGRADVAVPDYSQLGDWQHWERIGWTAEIASYGPPRLTRRNIPWIGPTPVRSAADGLAGIIKLPHVQPGDLWSFPTSSGWDVVAATAQDAGYSARISDKGQRAIAVMRLLDSEQGLRLLSSSRLYGLLDNMSETVQRQAIQRAVRRGLERLAVENVAEQQEEAFVEAVRGDVTEGAQFDRQHFSWNQVKEALGPHVSSDACNRVIEWLVEHRVLFQGYKFRCANCGVERWYSINRLADIQTCEGCGHASARPISSNQLSWRYRLNETVAQAVDQGLIPHLLVLNRMLAWRHDDRSPLFGFLPGVLLTPRDAPRAEEIEVDVLAIKGRRVIIGECKRGGDRITDRIVDRFAAAARRLNCSRIVYATASHFDDDAPALERARQASSPAVVESWDRTALFDCRNAAAQDEPVAYLQRILESL
jgi:hypothetical protein